MTYIDQNAGGGARCSLCGEPMPTGEEMFKFHGYSGPCPAPPLPKPKTFEQYLRENMDQGQVDLSLRVVSGPNGEVDFYIHPANASGETLDMTVSGNNLARIPDEHGAGSRPANP